MAVEEGKLRVLMKLGLTEYEARAYLVLVKLGSRSAGEVSFLGKIPRPKTYGAVKSLEAKGFLKTVKGKPERYMAASPNEVLLPLVEGLTRDIEECNSALEELALSYESSKYIYIEKPYETHDFWTVRGRGRVNGKILEMVGRAKGSIYITLTANGVVRTYKAYSKALEEAAKRNVDVRVLAPLTPRNETAIRELKQVVKVKVTDTALARYLCVDTDEIMFIEAIPDNTEKNSGEDTASWTNDPLLVRIHKQLFLNVWQKGHQR